MHCLNCTVIRLPLRRNNRVLISHRKQFVFIKTSKTAGTSVESFFEKYCFPEGEWHQSHSRDQYIGDSGLVGGRGDGKHDIIHSHMPAKGIKKLLTDEQWESYLKFTIIRNPFDRLVSRFFFEMKNKSIDVSVLTLTELRRYFDVLVKKQNYPIVGQISLNNSIAVDFLIRFEQLQSDLQKVCGKLAIECDITELPTYKADIRDKKISLHDIYTKDLVRYVEEEYAEELDLFGYEFPH